MTISLEIPVTRKKETRTRVESKKGGITLSVSVGVIFSFFLLLSVAGVHAFLVSAQQEVDSLEFKILEGRAYSQELRIEVAELKNPERILIAAKGRLGMLPPPTRKQIKPISNLATPDGNPFRR